MTPPPNPKHSPLPHCIRCGCSIDIGDASEWNPDMCAACSMIRSGVDPFHALKASRKRKMEAEASEALSKAHPHDDAKGATTNHTSGGRDAKGTTDGR